MNRARPSQECTYQPGMATTKTGLASDLHQGKRRNLRDTKEWKSVTAWSLKRSPCQIAQLPLLNRYKVLGVVHEGSERSEGILSSYPSKARSTKAS